MNKEYIFTTEQASYISGVAKKEIRNWCYRDLIDHVFIEKKGKNKIRIDLKTCLKIAMIAGMIDFGFRLSMAVELVDHLFDEYSFDEFFAGDYIIWVLHTNKRIDVKKIKFEDLHSEVFLNEFGANINIFEIGCRFEACFSRFSEVTKR